jgi:hypothetical protein
VFSGAEIVIRTPKGNEVAVDYDSVSFASALDGDGFFAKDPTSVLVSAGYNPFFRSDSPLAANGLSPMALMASRALGEPAATTTNPFTINQFSADNRPKVMEAPAIAAGAIALAAHNQKVVGNINFGQHYEVSEKANTTKFFDGQQQAEKRNDVKLAQTEQSAGVLAEAHHHVMGAAHKLKVEQLLNPTGAPATTQNTLNNTDPVSKGATTGGLVRSMLLGSAASSVAAFLMPTAVPVINAASAWSTATQSAALAYGGNGVNYDRPRTKAEAREMDSKLSAAANTPENPYVQAHSTAGSVIPFPKERMAFNAAAKGVPPEPNELDPRALQVRELEKAASEIRKEGEMQVAQNEDATIAAARHEDWKDAGVTDYGLGEVIRAAEAKALGPNGEDLRMALENIENKTELMRLAEEGKIPGLMSPQSMVFAPSLTFTSSAGPKLG